MSKHKGDVDYAHELVSKTLTCGKCSRRLVIEKAEPGIDYCVCRDKKKLTIYGHKTEGIPWTPFLERRDIVVWRHPHPNASGLFVYLMYGRFDDVTPREFLEVKSGMVFSRHLLPLSQVHHPSQVQLDLTEFRLSWDKNSAQCHVIEEEYDEKRSSLSQIYYWEVNWPRFFANRDYVCTRRTTIFESDNVGVIYREDVHSKLGNLGNQLERQETLLTLTKPNFKVVPKR